MAKFYFYYGTMGSSKSAQMLMNAYSMEERGVPFICLKPSVDTRDGVTIVKSRVGIERECIVVNQNDNIIDMINRYVSKTETPQWILIDESQFLTTQQVDELAHIVDTMNINVICYGLRTDFMTHQFEGSKRLMEIVDDIQEIKISCPCGRKAIFNARIDENGNIIKMGEQIDIGGDEKYISLCRECYNKGRYDKNFKK